VAVKVLEIEPSEYSVFSSAGRGSSKLVTPWQA